MSYILNALRKSDAQRRLGQAPDLENAPPSTRSGASQGKRGRLVFLAIVPLFLLTMFVGWLFSDPLQQWLANRQDAGSLADSQVFTQPVASPAQDQTTGIPLSLPEEDPATLAEESRIEPEPDPQTASAAPASATDRRSIEAPRRRERVVQTPEEAQRLIDQSLAALDEQSPEDVSTSTTEDLSPQPAPQPEVAVEREGPDGVAKEKPWEPERSEFVRQWELPLSVRRELPSLNLSIHVFATEPESRFVLINGERRIEGDELGQGAQLVEIRREGALVQFRDYRFLLEP